MNRHTKVSLLATLVVFCLVLSATAQVPGTINYQGRLTDSLGNTVPDGTYEVTFTISNVPEGIGIAYWYSVISVNVTDGLFSCVLGEQDPIPYTAFAGQTRYLRISVDGTSVGAGTPITAVPYSIRALKADTAFNLPDGSVTNDMLAGNAVTGDKIANGTITTQDMLDAPGLTYITNASTVTLPDDAMTDLASDYIDIPNPGYVVVTGKCYCKLAGTTGANGAYFQIDDTTGGTWEEPWHTYVSMDAFPTTGSYYYPVYVSRVFYRNAAGRYHFRLEGRQIPTSTGTAESRNHVLTIIYMGSFYGKI